MGDLAQQRPGWEDQGDPRDRLEREPADLLHGRGGHWEEGLSHGWRWEVPDSGGLGVAQLSHPAKKFQSQNSAY